MPDGKPAARAEWRIRPPVVLHECRETL
jgi:hypothetical protein